jgi:hypothetical protein
MDFTNRINSIAQAVSRLWITPQKEVAAEQSVATTSSGRRYDSGTTMLMRSFDIFGMSNNYLSGVLDCKKLSEDNPIFSGIMEKVVGPVAEHDSFCKIDKVDGRENHPKKKLIEDDLNKLIQRIVWNDQKDPMLRNLLNEGGLSMEVIADSTGTIRALEYRPHYTIEPLAVDGRIVDPENAYRQVDITTREEVARFAKWQMAEVNWKESAFHSRGIPYLMASRRMLSSVGDMINGAVHKWIRSGGEIEVFGLNAATDWKDVEAFKAQNQEDLTPNSQRLIRQIFSKGEVNIQRLHGDANPEDTAIIEFLLELIFMATGVSKEVMGFKGNLVIADMASLSVEGYYRLLNRVQQKSHQLLKRVIDTQLLLQFSRYGVLPEQVEYELVAGIWTTDTSAKKVETTIKVVELLNGLMTRVENKQIVLEQIVGVLQYDLKDYGISFKEKLMVAVEPEPLPTPGFPKPVPKVKK